MTDFVFKIMTKLIFKNEILKFAPVIVYGFFRNRAFKKNLGLVLHVFLPFFYH